MPMRRGPCPALAPRGHSYFMQPRPPPSLCKRPKATSWILRLWFLMPNSHLKNAFAPSKLGTHTTKNPSPSTAPTKPMEVPAIQPTRRRWPHTPTCSAGGIRPRPTAKAPMRELEREGPNAMLHFAYAVADGGGLRFNYVINTLVGSRWVLSLLRHDAKLY